MRDLIERLTQAYGPSGREAHVRELIQREIQELVDELEISPLGSLHAVRNKGGDHRVMVAAHMDEIGMVVSHIEDDGYIRVKKVGGFDDRVLIGRMVDIYPDGKSESVPGVIGLKPPHLMKDRAKEMTEARGKAFSYRSPEKETIAGSRGAQYQGVALHSLRMPGLLAHQEVVLGGAGETLRIRHDTISRECYMPGVILAIKEVGKIKGLVFGLDKLLHL